MSDGKLEGIDVAKAILPIGTAVFGGLVNFYLRVRSGQITGGLLVASIGEVAASCFAGWLAWLVLPGDWLSPGQNAAVVGMAGFMGNKALAAGEQGTVNFFAKKLGISVPDVKAATVTTTTVTTPPATVKETP